MNRKNEFELTRINLNYLNFTPNNGHTVSGEKFKFTPHGYSRAPQDANQKISNIDFQLESEGRNEEDL